MSDPRCQYIPKIDALAREFYASVPERLRGSIRIDPGLAVRQVAGSRHGKIIE